MTSTDPQRSAHASTPPATPGEGWRRLRRIMTPRRNYSQVVVFLLCVLVGLSLAMQLQRPHSDLEGVSQQELIRMLDESDRTVESLEAAGSRGCCNTRGEGWL